MDAPLELLEAKLEDANVGSYPKDHARDLIRIVCSNIENLAPDDDHWITLLAHDGKGWVSLYTCHPTLMADEETKNRFFRCVIPLLILVSLSNEYALIVPGQTMGDALDAYEEFVIANISNGSNSFCAVITITRDGRSAPQITDATFSDRLTDGLVGGPFNVIIQYLRQKSRQTLKQVLLTSAKMTVDLSSLRQSQFTLVESFLYLYWNEIFRQIHPGAPAVGAEDTET